MIGKNFSVFLLFFALYTDRFLYAEINEDFQLQIVVRRKENLTDSNNKTEKSNTSHLQNIILLLLLVIYYFCKFIDE